VDLFQPAASHLDKEKLDLNFFVISVFNSHCDRVWSFSKGTTILFVFLPKVKDQICPIIFYTPFPSGGFRFGFKKPQSVPF